MSRNMSIDTFGQVLTRSPPSIWVRLHQSWYRKIVASHWILSNDQTQRNLADIQGNSLLRGSNWWKWRRWDTHVVNHLIPGISPEIKLSWSLDAHSTRLLHPPTMPSCSWSATPPSETKLKATANQPMQHQQKQYANLCMNLHMVPPCICMCLCGFNDGPTDGDEWMHPCTGWLDRVVCPPLVDPSISLSLSVYSSYQYIRYICLRAKTTNK